MLLSVVFGVAGSPWAPWVEALELEESDNELTEVAWATYRTGMDQRVHDETEVDWQSGEAEELDKTSPATTPEDCLSRCVGVFVALAQLCFF